MMMLRVLGSITMFVLAAAACAQGYPAKTIRIVVPFAPGGGTDILTRVLVPKMSELLKQQIVVDNRPGAGSQIGTEVVAKAAPDGYVLLMVDTAFTTNPSLYSKLPYNSEKGFRTGGACRIGAGDHGGTPFRPRHDGEGARRPRARETRCAQFCFRRAGQLDASRCRAAQIHCQSQSRSYPVQGNRTRRRRCAWRTGDDDVRWHQLGEAARGSGKAAGDRGHRRSAFARRCRTCRRSTKRV